LSVDVVGHDALGGKLAASEQAQDLIFSSGQTPRVLCPCSNPRRQKVCGKPFPAHATPLAFLCRHSAPAKQRLLSLCWACATPTLCALRRCTYTEDNRERFAVKAHHGLSEPVLKGRGVLSRASWQLCECALNVLGNHWGLCVSASCLVLPV